MKEQKKPILLVTAIVVLMGVIMVINASGLFGKNKPQAVAVPQQEPSKADNAINVDRADAIDKLMLSTGVVQGDESDVETEAVSLVVPEKPTIEIPRSTGMKQTPEENSTAAQWWTEDSHSKERSEEIARSRGGQ